jgi:hypothetical protein
MSVGGTGLMYVDMYGWSEPLHPTIPLNQETTSDGKQYEYQRPQLLCVLLVHTHLRIDLALIPL